jgi:pyrophosphate--fructose-6-phosphate 1-phosphotransferase
MRTFAETRIKDSIRVCPALDGIAKSGPLRVGVLFSGGPAAGGSNVVCGLFDALHKMNKESQLIGFLGGPSGILDEKFRLLEKFEIDNVRNLGGFDLLGTGRTKITTAEQFEITQSVIQKMKLDGLVIIGGDDSNTNAYFIHDHLKKNGVKCFVVGVPKTIDGDLKSKEVEISFGFDTACKVYSEIIGNICVDAKSSLKYWHFIKLMGRTASHVTLECALQTCPNIALIGEEISQKKWTLKEIVSQIADSVEKRSSLGKNYGVILIPEGTIEFIPEVKILILELNRLLEQGKGASDLSREAKECFDAFPKDIQNQLLEDRDSHGNVQVSHIETEKLFSKMVSLELKRRESKAKFYPVHHFFGYEGRCSFPSEFDAVYCYNLGRNAAVLIQTEKSGVISVIQNLAKDVTDWKPTFVDLEKALIEEERGGKIKKVIAKSLVDLNGPVFKAFRDEREENRINDNYKRPGPIQFSGPLKDLITKTLYLESFKV